MKIILDKLSKKYDNKLVLDEFSAVFTDERPNIIMGESGRGKTTLLNIILGLQTADGGTVQGLEDKKLSVVFQEDRLCQRLNAIANVLMVCPDDIDRQKIYDAFAAVGLDKESLAQPVSSLSGGMKRRVAIVRALMAEYDVIIMDEPFKGLDEMTRQNVLEYIKQSTAGKLLILVTHNSEDVSDFDGKLLMM